ncbi:MAG: hypothetical protein KF712_05280 [Akkermansiaceae bacterium]|nr:hypothetical protein [Akkermansiaceae bacterium]
MIQRFDINIGADSRVTNQEIFSKLGRKGYQEFQKAQEFLDLWKIFFHHNYGNLLGISHLSNPDDPPDIIAHFEKGEIPIEITSITPRHIFQSDAMHGKSGRNIARQDIPVSKKPKDAQEAREWMYGQGGNWESLNDSNRVWHDEIISSVTRKLSNPSNLKQENGILLLVTNRLFGHFNEEEMVKIAMKTSLDRLPEEHNWMIAIHNQWNSSQCFSVLTSRFKEPMVKNSTDKGSHL